MLPPPQCEDQVQFACLTTRWQHVFENIKLEAVAVVGVRLFFWYKTHQSLNHIELKKNLIASSSRTPESDRRRVKRLECKILIVTATNLNGLLMLQAGAASRISLIGQMSLNRDYCRWWFSLLHVSLLFHSLLVFQYSI